LARESIRAGNYRQALSLLERAENYPHNLGEGKLPTTQENDIHYLRGVALEKSGEAFAAVRHFRLSVEGISEPVQAVFYNDPQPDKIFYQGLGWLKLKEPGKAADLFDRLISFGEEHLEDTIRVDYFAVSLPDMQVFDTDLNAKNKIHCIYLQALGNLGKGGQSEIRKPEELFRKVLELDANHQGALTHLRVKGFI
jgi:tetratricopeptide (TPR) repeat protein